MKIFLYILLGLAVTVGGLIAWFFFSMAKVPKLEIPPKTNRAERIDLIDNYLTNLQKDGKFNGAILIATAGEPELMQAYGFTNHKLETQLTISSSFRLASVSKQFTAAAILRAAELGLLELDSPITDYLDLPYPEVTVRQLLNQTSGIPDAYMDLAEANRASIGGFLTVGKVVALLAEHQPATTGPPGSSYSYSNTGYVLLAAIVEAVFGQSFEDFASKELFAPLGMKNTRVWNLASTDETFPNKTQSFFQVAGVAEPLEPDFIDGVAGDGAVFASIEDFLVWDDFWNGNKLISDSLLQQAFQAPTLTSGEQSDYGFGWVTKPDGRHWHNGGWLGARTYIGRNPAEKTVLVLLDNSMNMRMDGIVGQITKALQP